VATKPLLRWCLVIMSGVLTSCAAEQSLRGGQAMQRNTGPLYAGIEVRDYMFEPTKQQMKYALFVPRSLDRTQPSPLVIVLHGSGGSPESVLNPLAPAADKHHYIVAAPTGYTPEAAYGFMRRAAGPAERENSRLSEIDVMNVLGMQWARFPPPSPAIPRKSSRTTPHHPWWCCMATVTTACR